MTMGGTIYHLHLCSWSFVETSALCFFSPSLSVLWFMWSISMVLNLNLPGGPRAGAVFHILRI